MSLCVCVYTFMCLPQMFSKHMGNIILPMSTTYKAEHAGKLEALLTVMKPVGGQQVITPATATACEECVRYANATVSVTYALYHVHVAFAQLKGPQQLSRAADKLRQEIQEKKAWRLLPRSITTAISACITVTPS